MFFAVINKVAHPITEGQFNEQLVACGEDKYVEPTWATILKGEHLIQYIEADSEGQALIIDAHRRAWRNQ
jgi:hypothetical protein